MQDASTSAPRSRALLATFFFVAALALRGAFFLQARNLEFFQVLGLDAQFYHDWAQRLAAGTGGPEQPYFQGPLYPYFLSLLYRVFGAEVIVAQIAQLVLGAVSTSLVFLLGDRIFGRATGVVAATLFGAYGYLMFLESHLVAAPMLVFLCLVFALTTAKGIETDRLGWLLAGGILLGILATGRGLFLALIPWTLLVIVVARRGPSRSKALWQLAAVTVGAALGVLPVTIHNLVAGGELVIVTTNGGINYYIGNHDGATGAFTRVEGVQFFQPGSGQDGGSRALAEQRSGESLTAGEASRWWLDRGLRWNLSHPGRTVALWAKKLLLVVSDYEIPQIENYGWARDDSSFLRLDPVRWGWLFALALVGMVAARRRGPKAIGLVILVSGLVVSLLPFFVTARFRVVMVPLLAVLAAHGLVFVWQSVRAQQMRRAAVAAGSFLTLAVVFNLYSPAGVQASSDMLRDYSRGITAMQAGNFEEASTHFARALAKDDRHPPTLANLAFCLAQTGQPSRAAALYREAMELDPSEAPRLRQFLIGALIASGDDAGAIEQLQIVLRDDPDDLGAHATLGDVYLNRGDDENGRRHWSYVAQHATDPQMKAAAEQRLAGP